MTDIPLLSLAIWVPIIGGLLVLATGSDRNAPLARMLAHSDTYREMTRRLMQAADTLCGGRLVMVHEGGYSEAYVPFCGQAIMETLSGCRTLTDAGPGLLAAPAWP